VKIDEDVWDAFKSFVVKTHGQKYGNLGREVENALDEYVDQDRLQRVDAKVDRVLTRLDEIDGSHTHKASEATAKVERIAERINNFEQIVIPTPDVRRAIENVAGADDRTIEKYQRLLRSRGLAYEHPSDNVWFVERERWAEVIENHLDNNPTVDIHDLLDDYPLGVDDYDELAEAEVLV